MRRAEADDIFAPPPFAHYPLQMSPNGLAIFVFFAFLVPVPLVAWLDRARGPNGSGKE
jgi:hypothetical protein